MTELPRPAPLDDNHPVVSVVMPLFKRHSLLVRAVDSLRRQTLQSWELLLVQDGDFEGVTRAAAGLAKTDPRIRHIRRGQVGSIGAACNHALRHGRGRFVAILDDDDEWLEPLKLSLQVEFLLENPDHIGCGSGYISADETGKILGTIYKPQFDRDIRKVALLANPIANSTSMFRREWALEIGGYDETLRDFQDWDFWLKCLARGKLFNFHLAWARYTVWNRGSSFLNIRSNAVSAQQIVSRYAKDFEGSWKARLLVTGYSAYAWTPVSVRSVSFVLLSGLKKQLFSTRGSSDRLHFRRDLPCKPTVCVIIPSLGIGDKLVTTARLLVRSGKGSVKDVYIVDGLDPGESCELIETFEGVDLVRLGNPDRFKPHAVNRAVARTRSDLVLIADAHSIFSSDYVSECIKAIRESGALNVGGAQRYRADCLVQFAVAIAVRCRLGSGGARYKDPDYSGFAESVYLGCFLREALMEVSRRRKINRTGRTSPEVFSERNVTNQDAEVNERLAEIAEFPVFISEQIRVWYSPRREWKTLAVQYFRYGRGRCLTSAAKFRLFARGNLPFALLLASTAALGVGLVLDPMLMVGVGLVGINLLAADVARVVYRSSIYDSSDVWVGQANLKPPRLKLTLFAAFAVVTMIACHGAGFGFQVLRLLVRRRLNW